MKKMLRYVISADGNDHTIIMGKGPVRKICTLEDPGFVELWPETEGTRAGVRTFRVFGGFVIPDSYVWQGTADRHHTELVWHLYEKTED